MKKRIGGGAGIVAIIAYIVVKFLVGSAIRGNSTDPTNMELRLMVNSVIEAIELRDYQEFLEAEKLAIENQPEITEDDDSESDELYVDYDNYSFMEKYEGENLFKNAEFAKDLNIDMGVFDNEYLAKLLNIVINFKIGEKDEDGYFINRLYTISAKYNLEDNLGVKSGNYTSYINDFKRSGVLIYQFDDVVPVYKRLVERIVLNIENYKSTHNNDLSELQADADSSLVIGDPLSEKLDYDGYLMNSDIWDYPINQKINLVFDKENGSGDGKDGNYILKVSIQVTDENRENKETFEGSYNSSTKKWTGDFND